MSDLVSKVAPGGLSAGVFLLWWPEGHDGRDRSRHAERRAAHGAGRLGHDGARPGDLGDRRGPRSGPGN